MAGSQNKRPDEPAIVVQQAYDLTLWLVRKVETFPRSFKFSVGDRMVARSLDLLEQLVQAAYASDKRDLLERANRSVNSVRYLLRLGADLGLLSEKSREFASGRLEEIGRMIGGWRKAASQRSSP